MLEEVRAGGLLPAGTPVVAMLSGGRDSVCLLDLAVWALGADEVTALHVNYGLRDDSDADERHCAALCERLGARLEVERPCRPEGPGNLQSWARDTRYAAAARLALPHGATIATGHTADDQVETILYRLASSPSRRALLGMRPRDGRLARPLLAFTRAETTAYCEERGLAWRDDASNAEADLRAQPGAPRPAAGARRRSTRPPPRTCCARRRCCATRRRCSTPSSTPSSTAPRLAARTRSRSSASPSCRPALRRLVVQRLADRAAGPPGRRRRPPRRGGRGAAPHRHRDARPRRRRPRRSPSAASCAPSADKPTGLPI